MDSSAGLYLNSRRARTSIPAGLCSAAVAVALLAGMDAVSAQDNGEAVQRQGRRTCNVIAAPRSEGSLREVHALCWGTGLVLGSAQNYQSYANPELEATVVELERDGEKRVLLVRPDVEGRPFLETLDGALAVRAGRRPWSGLEGLSIDFTEFAEAGRLGIAPDAAGARAQGGFEEAGTSAVSTATIELSIADYIASDAQRVAAVEVGAE